MGKENFECLDLNRMKIFPLCGIEHFILRQALLGEEF